MANSPKGPLQIRIPPDIRQWLATQAVRNGASMNSEIIRAVRDRMERIRGSEDERRRAA